MDFNYDVDFEQLDNLDSLESTATVVDTRNSKYQARLSHSLFALSNKSHNAKQLVKLQQKRQAKEDREGRRLKEAATLR